jgi:hypothetical protein
MHSGRTRKGSTKGTVRRFVVASAVAVLATVALLPGSGLGSSGAAASRAQAGIRVGLATAIHARLGAATIRASSAASAVGDPYLGTAVALSADGTTALVGAPGVGGGRGAAYIFHAADAGTWSSIGTPTATLRSTHSGKGYFGNAVALSADGTTAFVGAPGVGSGEFPAGAIYVFHVSAEDAWSSTSKPKATLTDNHSDFVGRVLAVSSDGTTLVAGDDFYKFPVGGAFVFHVSSEGAWASTSKSTATLSIKSADDAALGVAAEISGDGKTVIVSDFDAGPKGATGGGAAVYHVSAESAWTTSLTPTAILSNADGDASDSRGNDLALSGDGTLALVSAPGADAVDLFYAGAAWATSSTPTATLTDDAVPWSAGRYRVPVAVSSDGTTALVLAPGVDSAYIFRSPSVEGAWVNDSAPTVELTNSGGKHNDFLGYPGVLSADGATALVGASGVRSNTGAADVFHVTNSSAWVTNPNPTAKLTDDALAACVVPKLKGLKLRGARAALEAGRCKLGKVTRAHSTKAKKGRVLSQSKKARKRLAIGAKVSLRVGN